MNISLIFSTRGFSRRFFAAVFALCILIPCLAAPRIFANAEPFQPEDVEAKARALASRPYQAPDKHADESLLHLSFEQWNSIRFKPENTLWRDEGLPFTAHFFPPGFIYDHTVGIHIVEGGNSSRLSLTRDMFDFSGVSQSGKAPNTPLGAAGFRLLFPLRSSEGPKELASFLGATFFRALGKHATYGIYARGLALNTATSDGEEFPCFRDFWLVKPGSDSESMIIYALMDSPGATGAFCFEIRPGTSTIMDVDSKFFFRKDVKIPQKIGLAPLSSMFLHSESANGKTNDYRPEAHNSDGLLYSTDRNSWFWRPLVNPERLGVNVFPLSNPRGFGLLQRDNVFDHYQDIAARFELRSSLWVEPIGDWGNGRIELVEIPTKDDIHENINVFWVPDEAQGEAGEKERIEPIRLQYRLYWMSPGVNPHNLGRVAATRIIRLDNENTLRFIVDFEGEAMKALSVDTGLTSVVEVPDQIQLLDKQLIKNPVTGGWRLSFRVRLPQRDVMAQIIPLRGGTPAIRFRALLKRGENLPDPLTEVWIYDLPS